MIEQKAAMVAEKEITPEQALNHIATMLNHPNLKLFNKSEVLAGDACLRVLYKAIQPLPPAKVGKGKSK
jgi:hypothetical protein